MAAAGRHTDLRGARRSVALGHEFRGHAPGRDHGRDLRDRRRAERLRRGFQQHLGARRRRPGEERRHDAIGLEGSNTAQMDQLAQAGGTMQGIYIGNSANAEQELLAALNAIRGMVVSCDFPLPKPTDPSMAIDPAKINITFSPSSGAAGTLRQVPDEPSCATSKAWHYDMPQNRCASSCALQYANSCAPIPMRSSRSCSDAPRAADSTRIAAAPCRQSFLRCSDDLELGRIARTRSMCRFRLPIGGARSCTACR